MTFSYDLTFFDRIVNNINLTSLVSDVKSRNQLLKGVGSYIRFFDCNTFSVTCKIDTPSLYKWQLRNYFMVFWQNKKLGGGGYITIILQCKPERKNDSNVPAGKFFTRNKYYATRAGLHKAVFCQFFRNM